MKESSTLKKRSRNNPVTEPNNVPLLDEQEQEDIIHDLSREAMHHMKLMEWIMASVCAIFSVGSACLTVYLLLVEDPRSWFVLLLCGIYSTYMHLISGVLSFGFDGSTSFTPRYCINPASLLRRLVHVIRMGTDTTTRGEYVQPSMMNVTKEDRRQELRIHLLNGILPVLIPCLLYPILISRRDSSSSTNHHHFQSYSAALTFIMVCCNVITLACAAYMRRDAFSTTLALQDVEKSKYRYKSL